MRTNARAHRSRGHPIHYDRCLIGFCQVGFDDADTPLAITGALALMATSWLFEWKYYWRLTAPPFRKPKRPYTVDIFTTACPGEPLGMIERTLRAMQNITYPAHQLPLR